jgi:hypothetical protein
MPQAGSIVIHVFCGFDRRESVGFHVFVSSLLEHASRPVSVHPLSSRGMPVGSNEFTFSRFLVPWLCGFTGRAIFCDGADMLCLGDIVEVDALFNPGFAVQVVKRPSYRTAHREKYVGTIMQCPNVDYPRKQWASVMLINCAAPEWRAFTPETLGPMPWRKTLQFEFLRDERIGDLPEKWNRVVDEGDAIEGAALLHWTAGIPAFSHYRDAPGASQWHAQRSRMLEVA